MKHGIGSALPLEKMFLDAHKAVGAAVDAVRHAEKHVLATYRAAHRQAEKGLSASLVPVSERLYKARYVTKVAQARLFTVVITFRARRMRARRRSGDKKAS